MTDNRNRTVAEVRHAFNKYGGNLGIDGLVAYLFSRQGVINFAPGVDEEAVMDAALEAGAEDIEGDDDGAITVTAPWENLNQVVTVLIEAGFEPDHSEVTMVPSTTNSCDTEQARKVLTLIDVLEDLDDVQEVYSNGEFPDDAYE
jgi:YebC/PmpR family DNA-binding regulatory protein